MNFSLGTRAPGSPPVQDIPTNKEEDDNNNTLLIALCTVGGVLVVAFVIYYVYRKKKRNRLARRRNTAQPTLSASAITSTRETDSGIPRSAPFIVTGNPSISNPAFSWQSEEPSAPPPFNPSYEYRS